MRNDVQGSEIATEVVGCEVDLKRQIVHRRHRNPREHHAGRTLNRFVVVDFARNLQRQTVGELRMAEQLGAHGGGLLERIVKREAFRQNRAQLQRLRHAAAHVLFLCGGALGAKRHHEHVGGAVVDRGAIGAQTELQNAFRRNLLFQTVGKDLFGVLCRNGLGNEFTLVIQRVIRHRYTQIRILQLLARLFQKRGSVHACIHRLAALEEVALIEQRVLRHLFLVGQAGKFFLDVIFIRGERRGQFFALEQRAIHLQQIEIHDDDAHRVHGKVRRVEIDAIAHTVGGVEIDAERFLLEQNGLLRVGVEESLLLFLGSKVLDFDLVHFVCRQEILLDLLVLLDKAQTQRIVAFNLNVERAGQQLKINVFVNGKRGWHLHKLFVKTEAHHHIHGLLRGNQPVQGIGDLLLFHQRPLLSFIRKQYFRNIFRIILT